MSEPENPAVVKKLEACVQRAGFVQVIASAPPNDSPPSDVLWVVQFGDRDVPFDLGEHEPGAIGDIWVFRDAEGAKDFADDESSDEGTRIGHMVVLGEVDPSPLKGCRDLAAQAARQPPKQRYND